MTIKFNIKKLFKGTDLGLWRINIEILFMQQNYNKVMKINTC